MSTEKQLEKWLRRSEKTFCENLNFAIRAMQSAEFTFTKKYEIFLTWLAEEGETQNLLDYNEIKDVLDLRLPTRLISLEIKERFVDMLIRNANAENPKPFICSFLCKLLATEWLQDLLRAKHKVKARVYESFFKCFEKCLSSTNRVKLTAEETNLITQVLNFLKDHIQNEPNKKSLAHEYDESIQQPLTQVLLVLRAKYNIDFFDELRQIEQLLRVCTTETVKSIMLNLPVHSTLMTLECVLVNQRLAQNFHIDVIKQIFVDCQKHEDNCDSEILLLRAAYLLNIFQKHNMTLNYKIDEKSVLNYLGDHIHQYASLFLKTHLNEVLLLLCAALRLNPLILENHIFEITTWIIVTPKNTENFQRTRILFEEFLILLLEMFRRLSRAEKFVVNLLKALNKWLNEHELESISKKLIKRKLDASPSTSVLPSKRERLSTVVLESVDAAATKDTSVRAYMEMFFEVFNRQNQALKHTVAPKVLETSFTYLQTAWPSDTIGFAFSRLITGLVNKASLTIWKTLLYALKDQLNLLTQQNVDFDTENAHFRLDIHAALLCQYFAGAKLNEQYEKHFADIQQQRALTKEVLGSFGKFVLNREYHKRTVSAYLECCYYAANFELMLAYYKPDGFSDDSLSFEKLVPDLHAYLAVKEWSVIQQRIRNYGKRQERKLYERLLMQRAEAQQLLQSITKTPAINLAIALGCDVTDPAAMLQFLSSSLHAHWLIKRLNRNEKIALIHFQCENLKTLDANKFLEQIGDDAEALELLAFSIFERLNIEVKLQNQYALITALNCNFDSIRQCSSQDHMEIDKIIKTLSAAINENFGINHKVKHLPEEIVDIVIELLAKLPFGYLRRQTKTLIFIFYLALYQDLRIAQATDKAEQILDSLTDFLHFGPQVPIFRYFNMKKILELLPIAVCSQFYKFLFSSIKNEEKGTDEFLKSLEEMLRDTLESSESLKSEQRRLLLIAIDSFANFNGVVGRRIHKHLYALLDIYGNYIYGFFGKETNAEKSKKFVEKTLSGFASFAKAILVAATAAGVKKKSQENNDINEIHDTKDEHEQHSMLKPLDEDFRRICKIYIGHSMNNCNSHAIRLMQVALNHRKLLHLDQDEIELVLTGYWRKLNALMLPETRNEAEILNSSLDEVLFSTTTLSNQKNSEALMRMIIENKTNEDLLLTLKELSVNATKNQNHLITIELLMLIGKSKFSTIKGAIFNEQFKQISCNIIHRLMKSQQQFVDHKIVLKMLGLQQIFAENKSIPITPDTLDSILAFLIEINIKKFILNDSNGTEFFASHAAMTSLCATLIKQRHILLMDRIPEFMQIFKDLVQAIIQYRSERQKETALDTTELDELAELALKLEVLMHNITAHSTDVKRVAPFVLMFTINLIVTCKRPTTLYTKIKTHIDAICYSLIGICDHRVGHFILRCSNEAARQTYELLVKDHKKYHKFKGKV